MVTKTMGFLKLLDIEKNIMKIYNNKFLNSQKELDDLKFSLEHEYNDFFKKNYKQYNSQVKVLKVQSSLLDYDKDYETILRKINKHLKEL